MDQRVDRRYRLKRREDIARLFERGLRGTDRILTVLAMPREDGEAVTRFGVGVSRRHGGAVRRNRIKRLCREAFRAVRDDLPAGWDFMLVPRAGQEFTLAALQSSVRSLGRRLHRQANEGRGS